MMAVFPFFQLFLLPVVAEELFYMSVLGFIREVLGTDLGPTATTGNGEFCDAFSFKILCAFR